MNVAVAMALLTAVALFLIWAPAYPATEPRHEHMVGMDRLAAERERHQALRYPHGRCWSCQPPLDALGGCTGVCDPADDAEWEW